MKRFSVAFLADYFVSWMGGANLLGSLLNCLARAAPAQNASIHVLFDATQLPEAIRSQVDDFLPIQPSSMTTEGPLKCLLDSCAPEHLIFYRDLARTLKVLEIDAVGPSGTHLGPSGTMPWFGYIPDFQHDHLAENFSQAERISRSAQFRKIAEDSLGVFVTSSSVASDIERFYPAAARRRRIFRLPRLLPRIEPPAADDVERVRARYGIPDRYLLSCSQRWIHKQHHLIVEAFAQLVARGASDLQLVFTGATDDYRDPAYGPRLEAMIAERGLAGRVHSLGLVPRADQVALIGGALALVQASLFEGNPGASGVLEAALLGTAVIASDIAVNREMDLGRIRYFGSQDPSDLVNAMAETLQSADRRAPAYDAAQIDALTMASGMQMLATMRSAVA
jgi:glycosyltransferase involved in cell wall biosynthesis